MSLLTNSFEIRHVDTSDRNKKFAVVSGFLDISNPEEVKNFIKSIKEQHSLVMGILNKPEQIINPEVELIKDL
jgi:hypothetical protein